MKAIILAAGIGTRIYDLINDKPKSFLKINNKTIIEYQIESLREFGIKDIIIITGYKKQYFENLNYNNMKILYNPFYKATNVLGSMWFAKDFLTEPFIFLHADTYFDKAILEKIIKFPGNNLAVELKKCNEEDMKVKIKERIIVEISKSLRHADGEFIGVAKFDDYLAIKDALMNLIEDKYNSFFEEIIFYLIKTKNLIFNAVDISGYMWEEIDFKEDYENLLNKLMKDKNFK